MPDQTWYCQVQPEDVPKIVTQHLRNDTPVKSLLHPRFHPQFLSEIPQSSEAQASESDRAEVCSKGVTEQSPETSTSEVSASSSELSDET